MVRRQTGGFRFHYEPCLESFRENANLYSSLFPTIDENVFIAGTITFNHSNNAPQKLTFSLPLAVATMRMNDTEQIRYTVTYNSGDLKWNGSSRSFSQEFPRNIPSVLPYAPKDWLQNQKGFTFRDWGSRTYLPGSRALPDVDSFTARWLSPKYIFIWDTGSGYFDTSTVGLIMSDVSTISYYIVGAGGNGGRGYKSGGSTSEYYGGGGGSGAFVMGSRAISGHIKIEYAIGRPTQKVTSSKPSTTLVVRDNANSVKVDENAYSGEGGHDARHTKHDGRFSGDGGVGGSPNGYEGEHGTDNRGGGLGGVQSDFRFEATANTKFYLNGEPQSNKYTGVYVSQNGADPKYGGGGTGVVDRKTTNLGAAGLIIVVLG